jgi:hypothetical protein
VSPVSVPTTAEPTEVWPVALLLALVVGVLLSAGLLVHAQRHRGASWVKAHVTVAPQAGPDATFDTRPDDETNRDHVLTVVPVEVERSTTMEENPR